MLSVRNCLTRRPRLAPTDMRTAISLPRAVPRTSRRLATLTHETSNTRPTMPMSTLSGVEYSVRRRSCPFAAGSSSADRSAPLGRRLKPRILCRDRCSRKAACTTACACRRSVPGFSRATSGMFVQLSGQVRKSGSSAARIDSGRVMSSARPGCIPSNPGAVTPTIVTVRPPTTSVLPRTSGSRPNRRVQKPSLMTAIDPPPAARSSSLVNPRPRAIGMPASA